MGYNCCFDLEWKEEIKFRPIKQSFVQAACYGNFYSVINQCKYIDLYITINSPHPFNCKFNDDEISIFNKLLEECEFKFKYSKGQCKYINDKLVDTHIYHIDFDENSIKSNKLLLNFIRYLNEENYPEIIKNLLMIHEKLPSELPFNKFLLAHYSRYWFGAHDIRGHQWFKILTKEQCDIILKSNDNGMSYSEIPTYNYFSFTKTSGLAPEKWYSLYKEDFLKFYDKYKQIKE